MRVTTKDRANVKESKENSLSSGKKDIWMIADRPTPDFIKGGVAYTLRARDYKGVVCVVVEVNHDAEGHRNT